MKKILFVIMAVIFCAANYSAAATLAEGKEKKIDNIDITIGDWKINGKVNGKIYISDDCEIDNKGRIKLGDSDAVTYSNGAIIVYMDEEKIEQLAADLEKNIGQLAVELEETFSDIEINGKRLNSNDWENMQNRPNRITGSGNIITKRIPAITGYDAIKASRAVTVTMAESEGDQITIKADDNIMPYVVVRKEGNSLVIGIDDNIKSINRIDVNVTLPKNSKLNELKASSAASININTTIEGRSLSLDAASAASINIAKADVDFFDADASSAANISGAVKSNDCYVDASSAANINLTILAVQCKSNASSAANIKLSGEVATFEGEASSAAKIEAKGVTARTNAIADASSGAKVTVNAEKRLDAKASSGGVVTYVHNSDLIKSTKQSSGGRVKEVF
ncbi:MAG: DUF2807 domain-containing protein [Alistipes sp.]|nr:DUF2807 domain-containing protein [Alistipes sp.]